MKLDLPGFANCMKHFERLQQRPSVQKLLVHETQVEAEFSRAT